MDNVQWGTRFMPIFPFRNKKNIWKFMRVWKLYLNIYRFWDLLSPSSALKMQNLLKFTIRYLLLYKYWFSCLEKCQPYAKLIIILGIDGKIIIFFWILFLAVFYVMREDIIWKQLTLFGIISICPWFCFCYWSI